LRIVDISARGFGPWVHRVDAATLRADLWAGVLGALLVLPQGIAFATLAGLPPEYGLYSAIVPCAVAALLGSSWHVLSGPTNANSLALAAMLAPLAAPGTAPYIELALGVTLLVGLMQWTLGTLRLGLIANFISPAALRGFTSGAALLIVLHALPDLLGLRGATGAAAWPALRNLFAQLPSASAASAAVAVCAVALALAVRRWLPRWPALLIGLAAGSALGAALNAGAGTLWGSAAELGPLPSIWPRLHAPALAIDRLGELLPIAFALTIVALGQSIAIAKVVAERSGQAIDANREFVGQGLSNIVGSFFSSYVSCGSLNRSLPNFEAGARTPLAGVFAALALLGLLALIAPLLGHIALPAVAGLLLLVGILLFDAAGWRRLWRVGRGDFAIAATTLLATVATRIEFAILLGTLLSLVAYLVRTSRPSMRVMGFAASDPQRRFAVLADTPDALPECPQLKLLRMEGEVYFGAVSHVAEQLHALRAAPDAPKHLLVMAKSMNFIDLAAADLWQSELVQRRTLGGDLYFHRPRPPVLAMWRSTGFIDRLGADHIFPDKHSAIAAIFQRLDPQRCARCHARIFQECPPRPAHAAAQRSGD
jgi:SulP family sulfate permease